MERVFHLLQKMPFKCTINTISWKSASSNMVTSISTILARTNLGVQQQLYGRDLIKSLVSYKRSLQIKEETILVLVNHGGHEMNKRAPEMTLAW